MISIDRLRAFEETLDPSREHGFRIVAYGEVSAVVVLDDHPDVVLKRMSGFWTPGEVEHYCGAVADYVVALRGRGVDVVPTEAVAVHTDEQGHVVHLVQERVPSEHLGPAWLAADDDTALALLGRIYDTVADTYAANTATEEVAIDAQLSNWVFDGERLRYIDVGTPFLRIDGAERLDWSLVVRPLPPVLRGAVLRFVVPGVVQRYHELDQVLVDVVANLVKEGRADLLDAATARANAWADARGVAVSLTARGVERYYARDAQLWELLSVVRRVTRWLYRAVGRPYPFLLPGKVKRR